GLESQGNTGIRFTVRAGMNSLFARSDQVGITGDNLPAFEREHQWPPIQLIHVEGWAAGTINSKVNGVGGCRAPFFLILPNWLVHVLQRRNRCVKLELIPIRVVPLTDRHAAGSGAVFQVIANALSKRRGVTVRRTIGPNTVDVKNVYLFPLGVS